MSQTSQMGTATPIAQRRGPRRPAPAVLIVAVLFVTMIGLSIWYLTRREPLVVQGEVQSQDLRHGGARRRTGRARSTSSRSQNVTQGAPLIRIDNPELHREAARRARPTWPWREAELARVKAGFRAETHRRAQGGGRPGRGGSHAGAEDLRPQAHARRHARRAASAARRDSAALTLAERALEQARFAYKEAVAGFTREDLGDRPGQGRERAGRCARRSSRWSIRWSSWRPPTARCSASRSRTASSCCPASR